MRKDKLVEISGGKYVAADVSTAAAAIIKAHNVPKPAESSLGELRRYTSGLDGFADIQFIYRV